METVKVEATLVKMPRLKCERCGHEWLPRLNNKLISVFPFKWKLPVRCANPKCRSPYWNRKKKGD